MKRIQTTVFSLTAILLVGLLAACSDGSTHPSVIETNGDHMHAMMAAKDEQVAQVVEQYFAGFNDVNEWSNYSTEHYVRNVYAWCTGEDAESPALDEIKRLYAALDRAHLLKYEIVSLTKLEDSSYELNVNREWDNGDNDNTTYSIIDTGNQVWKFDDRY